MCRMKCSANLLGIFVFSLFLSAVCNTAWSETVVIRLGVLPNLWFAQPAVIKGLGWDKEAGINLEIIRFSGLPAQSMAYLSGQIDGQNSNLATVALQPNVKEQSRIISATCSGDIQVIAVQPMKGKDLVTEINNFKLLNNRPARFIANTRGSLSDVLLRMWLKAENLTPLVEVINGSDQGQLLGVLLSKNADFGSVFAPLTEIIQHRVPGSAVVLRPERIRFVQPGGVLAVRREHFEAHREAYQKLISLYKRATLLMQIQPDIALPHIKRIVFDGLGEDEELKAGLINIGPFLRNDLTGLEDAAQATLDFMYEDGLIRTPISVAQIFETNP